MMNKPLDLSPKVNLVPVPPGTFYRPGMAAAGSGLRDFYGSVYEVAKDRSLRRIGPKARRGTVS